LQTITHHIFSILFQAKNIVSLSISVRTSCFWPDSLISFTSERTSLLLAKKMFGQALNIARAEQQKMRKGHKGAHQK